MMKTIKKIITLFLLVFLIPGTFVLHAQDDRLKQDLRVAESILAELINDSRDRFPFRGAGTRTVQGEYIDGYGVHFLIGSGISGRSISLRPGDDGESISSEEARDKIESILRDYLQNYAVLIRSLSDDEHVRLTYGLQSRAQRVLVFRGAGAEQQLEVPRISVWASVADLKSHRNGNLSDDQLQQRIRAADLTDREPGNDLNIFSSILKSSVDNAGLEHLRVSREPAFEYTPELGVHYYLDASARTVFIRPEMRQFMRDIDELNFDGITHIDIDLGEIKPDSAGWLRFTPPNIEFSMDSARIMFHKGTDSLRVNLEEIRKQAEEARIQAAEARQQAAEVRKHAEEARHHADQIRRQIEVRFAESDTVDYSADVEKLTDQIKTVIAGYGQTLQSLSDHEYLMITVNWRGRNLPDRTTIRIRKNDLLSGEEPDVTQID